MTPQELEELSFRNLVEYHREDLTKLMNGSPKTKVFTENRSRSLIKHGIITRGYNHKRAQPTPRAQEILNTPKVIK